MDRVKQHELLLAFFYRNRAQGECVRVPGACACVCYVLLSSAAALLLVYVHNLRLVVVPRNTYMHQRDDRLYTLLPGVAATQTRASESHMPRTFSIPATLYIELCSHPARTPRVQVPRPYRCFKASSTSRGVSSCKRTGILTEKQENRRGNIYVFRGCF